MTVTCNFCDKPSHEVMCMVYAEDLNMLAICDECVLLCVEIVAEYVAKKPITAPPWHVLAAALQTNDDEPQPGEPK